MRAVQLTAFGNPVDGLEYVDIPEPDAPGPNQVLIGVEFSPINPNDLMVAQGIYASRPPLPTVIGNEGVGRVLAVGPGVESVRVGDRVLAPPSSFTWRERMVVSAAGLSALPPDADPQQLAMLAINPPTAALLLSEYVDVKPGEWVVQKGSDAAGRAARRVRPRRQARVGLNVRLRCERAPRARSSVPKRLSGSSVSCELENAMSRSVDKVKSITHQPRVDRPSGARVRGIQVRLVSDLVSSVDYRSQLSLHTLARGAQFGSNRLPQRDARDET